MEKQILNYRIIIEPDSRVGTDEPCYTAYVPALGIATDADTIEKAVVCAEDAIKTYLNFLVEEGEEVPTGDATSYFVTTTAVEVSKPAPIH